MILGISILALGIAATSWYSVRKWRGTITVVRRQTQEQVRALELLGHATAYLVESYVAYGVNGKPATAELQAVKILMRLNMEVFDE